jgi:glycosyltransferase involved in cell wall biosynthesis
MTAETAPSVDFTSLRVAIIHEWFVDYSGSERVVEQMLNVFPQADLYAQVEFLPDKLRGFIRNKKVATSFIQKLPKARTKYRAYLPLMPLAVEQFDLSGYNLVISSNHAVAKGVITGPDQLHVCMCYSPIRYAWDLTHQYLRESGLMKGPKGWLAKIILHRIRMWDCRTANGVDEFIAISNYIARRIEKTYRRQSKVIYPPVDTDAFELKTDKGDFYLTVSRMVPYKRVDLMVDAFSRMPDKKLVVIGDGPDFRKVRRKAGPNVELLGFRELETVRDYMQRARAFVFAAKEDFGIVPVEAQSCGTPVIAYGRGGTLETVVEGKTGMLFKEQNPDCIIDAVNRFEKIRSRFDPREIQSNAQRFSIKRFENEFRRFMKKTIDLHYARQTAAAPQRLHMKGRPEVRNRIIDNEALKNQ